MFRGIRAAVVAAGSTACVLMVGVSALAAPAALGATPGWECIPTTAGQAVVSGGTAATPSCGASTTPVLAPTYVSSGVGGKPTVEFSAVNVQVVSGSGSTSATPTNGEGNLVVGYAENTTGQTRTGSNDLIVGSEDAWKSYGQIVGGFKNQVNGKYATALGDGNTASGGYSLAAGETNKATGIASTAIAGEHNQATGDWSSITGGESGLASDPFSSITGGCDNLSGTGTVPTSACSSTGLESISGGNQNSAQDWTGWIGGGWANTVKTGSSASVSGGDNNSATGDNSSVSGGEQNAANATGSSILGDSSETENVADAAAGVFQQHFPISVGSATIAGTACLRSTLAISGVQTGDVPMWTKTTQDLPAGLLFEPERITGASQLQGDFCNVSGSSLSEPGNEAYTYESLR